MLKQIAADGQITGYDIFGRQTRVMSRGAGIAAEIISAKYDYHMPFYRQQNWFAGSGWCPTRSTLLNILTAAECALRPLADYYRVQLMQDQVIGCDETPVTLLTPAGLPELREDASERDRRRHEKDQKGVRSNTVRHSDRIAKQGSGTERI